MLIYFFHLIIYCLSDIYLTISKVNLLIFIRANIIRSQNDLEKINTRASTRYNKAKKLDIPVVGCVHGAGKADLNAIDLVYDYLCIFGEKELRLNNYNTKLKKNRYTVKL